VAVPVPDRIELDLPATAIVLVCSDLLAGIATAASRQTEHDLADRLAGWLGPCALIFNGDLVELWADPAATVAAALAAHPELTLAVRAFVAEPDRTVVAMVGNHDAGLAWDGVSADTLTLQWGARCALGVDLAWTTPAGPPGGALRARPRLRPGQRLSGTAATRWTPRSASTWCRRCCRR
jgi:hypothetical protein